MHTEDNKRVRERRPYYLRLARIFEALLLSLLPLSCIIAPIRELGNITLSTTTIYSSTYNIALIQDSNMAINSVNDLFIGDEIRGHSLVLSMYKPRFPSIFCKSDKEYHIYLKRNSNRIDEDEPVSSIGNSQDKYMTQEKKKGQVSKMADNIDNICH